MKARSLALPTVLMSVTVLVMSGACSQHGPGSYEGGGREIPTSVVGDIGGEAPPPDASVQDNFVPPDTGNPPPDSGGNQG